VPLTIFLKHEELLQNHVEGTCPSTILLSARGGFQTGVKGRSPFIYLPLSWERGQGVRDNIFIFNLIKMILT